MRVMPPDRTHEGRLGRFLHACCDVCAALGGSILVAMAAMTVTSVVGRAFFARPILGDVELVQLGTAVCVALFLPYTQLRGGNIIVDFFTQGARPRSKARLDAFGALLYTLVMALVCWRLAAGALSAREAQETTMLMGIPLWIAYALMVPGFALSAVIGVHDTVSHWAAAPEQPR